MEKIIEILGNTLAVSSIAIFAAICISVVILFYKSIKGTFND